MKDPLKYLYRNPKSGVYTGYWACSRPTGKYTGLWPGGLLKRIWVLIGGKPEKILQPFTGLSKVGVGCDWNRHVHPDIIADAQHLPIKDDSFDCVLLDPPYTQTYVAHYAALDQRIARSKPKFSIYKAFGEGARVTRPGGFLSYCIRLVRSIQAVISFTVSPALA